MEHAGSLSPTTPEHQGVGTVWRQVAVKPYDFRLTKKQDYKTEEESITV